MGLTGRPSPQSSPGSHLLGSVELYLMLLFLPGLLNSFLLSSGNLSPPMSSIFSDSWKERGHCYHQVQRKPLLPRVRKEVLLCRKESWLSSSWTTQGLLRAESQHLSGTCDTVSACQKGPLLVGALWLELPGDTCSAGQPGYRCSCPASLPSGPWPGAFSLGPDSTDASACSISSLQSGLPLTMEWPFW